MLGRSHCVSGLAAGLAVGSLALSEHPGPLLVLTGLTAAYALAPDLDSCGSTEARSFGFVTWCLAWLVRAVSGGHRHGTHSALGVAAFTGAAWLACLFRHTIPGRIALCVILAVGLASAMDALRIGGHAGSVLALAGAAAMCWTGYGLALVPLAAALGTATHLLGDSLTRCGIPLCWPVSTRHYWALPESMRFTTGRRPERWVVMPVLLVALALLGWHEIAGVSLITHARTAIGAP